MLVKTKAIYKIPNDYGNRPPWTILLHDGFQLLWLDKLKRYCG